MNVIVAGTDEHAIADAIASEGHAIGRVDAANRPALTNTTSPPPSLPRATTSSPSTSRTARDWRKPASTRRTCSS